MSAPAGSSLVIIGNFDGVHRGHRTVLLAGAEAARAQSLAPIVLTFHPHPSVVLRGRKPWPLTPIDYRAQLLCAVEPTLTVVVEPFTPELAALSPREFATRLLARALGARLVMVGDNFRFGARRTGDLDTLAALGAELGFETRVHELLGDDTGAFSSTRVRAALAGGDLGEVERILGRPHAVTGVVVRGDGRGRTLGAPTANLAEVPEVLPPDGVYACLVDRLGEDHHPEPLAPAVVNIGVRPTVGSGRRTVEAHLLGFVGDLYGARLRLHLLERLRGEQTFAGLEELGAQIQSDISRARAIVSARG